MQCNVIVEKILRPKNIFAIKNRLDRPLQIAELENIRDFSDFNVSQATSRVKLQGCSCFLKTEWATFFGPFP